MSRACSVVKIPKTKSCKVAKVYCFSSVVPRPMFFKGAHILFFTQYHIAMQVSRWWWIFYTGGSNFTQGGHYSLVKNVRGTVFPSETKLFAHTKIRDLHRHLTAIAIEQRSLKFTPDFQKI